MGRTLWLPLLAALLSLPLCSEVVRSAEPTASVGPGDGRTVTPGDPSRECGGEYLQNADGSWENGYAWRYGGVVPPDYGSFAEGYSSGYSSTLVLSGVYFLTEVDLWSFTMDAYVYDSDGTNPLRALCVVTDFDPHPIGVWPDVSRHEVNFNCVVPSSDFFVSGWGNWPLSGPGWYWAADKYGPGGMPRTNIAPGIGYPTGWNDPSIVWGQTASMGIGACITAGPTPIEETSWSRVKSLYR